MFFDNNIIISPYLEISLFHNNNITLSHYKIAKHFCCAIVRSCVSVVILLV